MQIPTDQRSHPLPFFFSGLNRMKLCKCSLNLNEIKSIYNCSKEARKQLLEDRPGIPNSTINAMVSVKWKVENLCSCNATQTKFLHGCIYCVFVTLLC